jgi:hypothetical protein
MFGFFKKRENLEELHIYAGCEKLSEAAAFVLFLKQTNPERLARLLKTPHKRNGMYPLFYAFASAVVDDYSVAVLLLASGADPYARLPGPYDKGATLLHDAIQERNLGKLRLLLLYNPDYEMVLDPKEELTAVQALQQWAQADDRIYVWYKSQCLTVADVAEQTAQASRKLIEYASKIKIAASRNDYAEAIYYCQLVQKIFAEQAELEQAIPYPSAYVGNDGRIKMKQPYLINFYREQVNYYLQLEQNYIRQARAEGRPIVYEPPETGGDPIPMSALFTPRVAEVDFGAATDPVGVVGAESASERSPTPRMFI